MKSIKKLTWDSDFFGFGIAQLEELHEASDLIFVDEFAKSNNIRLVQALADLKNTKFIEILENSGFHYVDTRVDFVMELNKKGNKNIHWIQANESDIEDIKSIADSLFIDSRFFHPIFDQARANELFNLWAEKAVKGEFDNLCLKSTLNGTEELTGLVTIKFLNEKDARIGLIGVSRKHLGKGIGTYLIDSAITFLKENDFEKLFIATQGKNLGAINLYIKSGFKIKSLHNWFYKVYK
jgi:dTDP-4-amino-4,6-dideoxy-D-galactose acyltransferase